MINQGGFLNAAVDTFASLEGWVLDLMALQTQSLLSEATVYYQCVDS